MSLEADLVTLLKRLKLGQTIPTLPDRLALARAQKLDYAAFLTLILADEVQRRDAHQLERRLLAAGFEERVTLTTSIGRRPSSSTAATSTNSSRCTSSSSVPSVWARPSSPRRLVQRQRGPGTRSSSGGPTPSSVNSARRAPTTASKRPFAATWPLTCCSSMTLVCTGSPSSNRKTSTRSSSSVTVTPASSSPATGTSQNGSVSSLTQSSPTPPSTGSPTAPTNSSSTDPATAPNSLPAPPPRSHYALTSTPPIQLLETGFTLAILPGITAAIDKITRMRCPEKRSSAVAAATDHGFRRQPCG